MITCTIGALSCYLNFNRDVSTGACWTCLTQGIEVGGAFRRIVLTCTVNATKRHIAMAAAVSRALTFGALRDALLGSSVWLPLYDGVENSFDFSQVLQLHRILLETEYVVDVVSIARGSRLDDPDVNRLHAQGFELRA